MKKSFPSIFDIITDKTGKLVALLAEIERIREAQPHEGAAMQVDRMLRAYLVFMGGKPPKAKLGPPKRPTAHGTCGICGAMGEVRLTTMGEGVRGFIMTCALCRPANG